MSSCPDIKDVRVVKWDVKCLTFSTQSGRAISVYIVFGTDAHVVLDKMLAATQGLLFVVLVAVSSASGRGQCLLKFLRLIIAEQAPIMQLV